MSTVKKAIVLAAGLGTRLRPFTCAAPKPLLPVWGVPMLERTVEMLRAWGVEDFAFNAHYLHEQVEAWAEDYRRRAETAGSPVKVCVSYEPEILGTGGVLNPLRDWIGDEPFYLVNGDIVVDGAPDPVGRYADFDSPDVIGCGLISEEGPRTIEVEPESRFVTCWQSPDPGVDGTFTYCGVTALKPEILSFIEPSGRSSLIAAYEKAMMAGKFIRAVKSDEMLWTDAGSIASYIDLNRDKDDNAFDALPQVKAALEAVGAKSPVEFLGARGSERVFFRCEKGIIVVYDDGNRDENALYVGHARYLKRKGLPVPEVLADLTDLKTTVFSYAGAERKMTLTEAAAVIETLVKFNALGSDPELAEIGLLPGFDAETWAWERGLFVQHCLGSRFQMDLPEAVEKELEAVAARLEKEPKALVHRDFQSTNVLWKNGALSFIDFQGMRLGPAAYDLASFLYDPYVIRSEKERTTLTALYAKTSGRADIADVLPFAAVQRLCQCLGAYGRLASVGQPQFGKFVLPALQNLLDAADAAGLDALGALAEDLIAREQKLHDSSHGHHHGCTCGHCHA